MGTIRILDDETINQIAAGEVVERPASVVKELVENAIDAGATRIIIELKEGGKSLIRIRDNGCGMSREDAVLAFEKHSTSKIKVIGDVYNIRSLGFRGEALASIASVAQVTLTTRAAPGTLVSDANSYSGTKLVIHGGEIKKNEEIGCPLGTTILVENLFFNVPARLKYLKSDRTELNHILSSVTAISLSYPGIFFELTHEGRRLIMSPGSGDLLETVSSILGKTVARQMVELHYAGPKAEVRGFVTKPSHTRANHKHIFLFINHRHVRSPQIVRAIREGFGTLLPPVRHPVGVIQLFIDPKELDVNIHPAKTEVRFQYHDDVATSVTRAVKFALGGKDLSSISMDDKQRGRRSSSTSGSNQGKQTPFFTKAEHRRMAVAEERAKYDATTDELHEFDQETSFPPPPTPSTKLITGKQEYIQSSDEMHPPPPLHGTGKPGQIGSSSLESPIATMRPIGQIGNLFIIVETNDGFAVIDQHAAHERVMYERLLALKSGDHVESQRLIEPISLELAPEEQEAVIRYQSLLSELGFEIEEFGGNTFMVKTVPVLFGKNTTPETIYDIIDELVTSGKVKNLEERKDNMLKLLACHSAIRGGEELGMPRIIKLLEELLPLENPFTCPHGRPTILRFPISELEKKFKRTGF